jgi:hypothetical protein
MLVEKIFLNVCIFRLIHTFNTMSAKTKQKKMAEFVTKDGSKKRSRDKDDDNSESKKAKSGQVNLNEIDFDCKKKTPKDKTWNLKIVSWNVAGIRAWLKVNL